MTIRLFALSLLFPATLTGSAGERLTVAVSPLQSFAPSNLIVRVGVAPDDANRALEITADSGEYYRSSRIQLDGKDAPRTITSDNTLTIDGIDNTDEFTGSSRTELSLEVVQEFQVVTSGWLAESGGGSAGSINVVTRSGANTLHGDAFVFGQSGIFNARPKLEETLGADPALRAIEVAGPSAARSRGIARSITPRRSGKARRIRRRRISLRPSRSPSTVRLPRACFQRSLHASSPSVHFRGAQRDGVLCQDFAHARRPRIPYRSGCRE